MNLTVKLCAFALAAFAAACVSAAQDSSAPESPALACPALEGVDVEAFHALAAPGALGMGIEEFEARVLEILATTPVPPEAASAETRIRVRVPPTGMWRLDNLATAWRDEDGQWRMARRDIDQSHPPPPPPPPPLPGQPPPPSPPLTLEEQFPVRTFTLTPEQGAELDARLADPCFDLEPDRHRSVIPLIPHEENGQRITQWVCVPDSSYYAMEVARAGRPTRIISIGCENRTLASQLARRIDNLR